MSSASVYSGPTARLRLQLSLLVHNTRKGDSYFVHLFPSHIPEDFRDFPSYPLPSDEKQHTQAVIVLTEPWPDRLWFDLYTDTDADDEDGLYSETPDDGSGYIELLSLKANRTLQGSFKDADGKEQAILHITWLVDETDREAAKLVWQHGIAKREADEDLIDPALITSLQTLYSELEHDEKVQNFFTFTSPGGKQLPILCWSLLLSTAFYDEPRERHLDTLALMMHLLRLSCASLRVSIKAVAEGDGAVSDVKMADLVGEMLSWIPRCFLYVADFERRGKKTRPTDFWTRPLTYPHLGLVGCDCEDVNGGVVYELADRLMYLHKLPLGPQPDIAVAGVQNVSRFLFQYSGGIGMGSLRTTPTTYEPHAQPLFLDRRYIQAMLDDGKRTKSKTRGSAPQYLPAIVVEGTNWTAAAWDRHNLDAAAEQEDRETPTKDGSYARTEKLFTQGKKKKKDVAFMRRILRDRIPALEMLQHKAYGVISAALFPQFMAPGDDTIESATALHLVFCEGNRMGIPTEHLLLYKASASNVQVHAELDHSYILHLKDTVLCDFPVSRIPPCTVMRGRASEAMAAELARRRQMARVVLSARTRDATDRSMEITAFMGASKSSLEIRVTDDASVTEFYL